MLPKKLLFILGTRPEAIKMAPIILELKKIPNRYDVHVCITAQHRQMLDQVLEFFKIIPNSDLNVMKQNQSLFELTASCLLKLEEIINDFNPELIFVQGDTTTAFVGALAAYYKNIKIAHIEAGLRSFNKYSPFPEEGNRALISPITDFHFAPSQKAKENLINSGITGEKVFIVGNPVIDSLFLGLEIIKEESENKFIQYFNFLDLNKKIILVTGHRRESFGLPFEEFCNSINEIALKWPDVQIVYPVHLNPNVQKPVYQILKDISNVHLIKPLDYPHLIWLLSKCYLVLTDSGGIQEEAPSLGKPVLVTREVTERTEGIDARTAILVGTNKYNIVTHVNYLLRDQDAYDAMSIAVNPYGDGNSSKYIIEILNKIL